MGQGSPSACQQSWFQCWSCQRGAEPQRMANECSGHRWGKAGFPPAASQGLARSITVAKQSLSPIPLGFLLPHGLLQSQD